MHVQLHQGRLELRYSPLALLPVLLPALITLLAARLIAGMPWESRAMWPVAVIVWGCVTLFHVHRLLWWSTVTFDHDRNLVRRGPEAIGRLADIAAVEQWSSGRRGLYLAFTARPSVRHRWRIPGVGVPEAGLTGVRLADELGVPFEQH